MWTEEKFNEMKSQLFEKASTDEDFRNKCIEDAHAAIKEISGMNPPEDVKVNFISNEPGVSNVVLPDPRVSEELSEENLDKVAGGTQLNANSSYQISDPYAGKTKVEGTFWSYYI